MYTLAQKSVLADLCRDKERFEKYWPPKELRPSALRFVATYMRNRPHAQEPWNDNISALLNYLVDAILQSEGLAADDPKGLSYMYELCGHIERNRGAEHIVADIQRAEELYLEDISPESLIPIGRIALGLPVDASEFRDETINEGCWLIGNPLSISTCASRLDLIKHILSQPSVDVNDREYDVIELAVVHCSIEIVKLLLEPRLGLQTDNPTWGSAVLQSIALKRLEVTSLLLEHPGGSSPLLLADSLAEATLTGHIETVEMLLDMGADPDGDGLHKSPTPIEHAAWKGCTDIVQLLLDRGAEPPEIKVIRAAAEQGHIDTARLLFREYTWPWYPEAQAEILLVAITAQQNNFLDFYIDEEHIDIEPLLEDEDDFEVLFTCISKACFSANTHAVLKLHEAGVPLDGPLWDAVQEGSSAMLMAEVSGDRDLIDALLGLGLDPVDPMESIFAAQFESGRFPRVEPKPETGMPRKNAFKDLSY